MLLNDITTVFGSKQRLEFLKKKFSLHFLFVSDFKNSVIISWFRKRVI